MGVTSSFGQYFCGLRLAWTRFRGLQDMVPGVSRMLLDYMHSHKRAYAYGAGSTARGRFSEDVLPPIL